MNICVTVNSYYLRYLYIMLTSLYENNENGSIVLYVMHRDFTKEDINAIEEITARYKNEVKFVWINPKQFDNLPLHVISGSTLSLEIFFRLLIPEYFTSLDRLLLLDVDIVVNKSLETLYNTDISDHALAAAPNTATLGVVPEHYREWYGHERRNWTHFNTGVLLWNLKYIHEKYPQRYLFQRALDTKIKTNAFEEETFNVVFGEREIIALDSKQWNFIATYKDLFKGEFQEVLDESEDELRENHGIIHFLARNPWGVGVKNEAYKIWWDYAYKTKYFREIFFEVLGKADRAASSATKEETVKANVLHNLLRMKGTKDIKNKIEERTEGHIYLYGLGYMAKMLCETLSYSNLTGMIHGYIDGYKKGEFYNKPILSLSDVREEKNMTIIVTPAYDINNICLRLRAELKDRAKVLSLMELLQ